MMELKITISAPDLSAALTELAKAVGSRPAGLLADATGTAAQQAAAREPEAYQSPGGHAGEMKQQPEPVQHHRSLSQQQLHASHRQDFHQ